MVGECFSSSEVGLVRICGVIGSENVDMSSDRVSELCFVVG